MFIFQFASAEKDRTADQTPQLLINQQLAAQLALPLVYENANFTPAANNVLNEQCGAVQCSIFVTLKIGEEGATTRQAFGATSEWLDTTQQATGIQALTPLAPLVREAYKVTLGSLDIGDQVEQQHLAQAGKLLAGSTARLEAVGISEERANTFVLNATADMNGGRDWLSEHGQQLASAALSAGFSLSVINSVIEQWNQTYGLELSPVERMGRQAAAQQTMDFRRQAGIAQQITAINELVASTLERLEEEKAKKKDTKKTEEEKGERFA